MELLRCPPPRKKKKHRLDEFHINVQSQQKLNEKGPSRFEPDDVDSSSSLMISWNLVLSNKQQRRVERKHSRIKFHGRATWRPLKIGFPQSIENSRWDNRNAAQSSSLAVTCCYSNNEIYLIKTIDSRTSRAIPQPFRKGSTEPIAEKEKRRVTRLS